MRTAPTITASSSPSSTYSGLPGGASADSAAKLSSAVSAVGPVWRCGEEARNAATSGGTAAAYRPR